MGYRSHVLLKTTTEGYLMMKTFDDEIVKKAKKGECNIWDRPLSGAEIRVSSDGNYRIEFDWVKWYDGYTGVDNFNSMVERYHDEDIPYKFLRIGEETGDIEEKGNWLGEDEIDCFQVVTDIDDDEMGDYTEVPNPDPEIKTKEK